MTWLINLVRSLWLRIFRAPEPEPIQPCYPVPGTRKVPIAVYKRKGQPILPPPTDADVERIRKLLDDHYGDRPVPTHFRKEK